MLLHPKPAQTIKYIQDVVGELQWICVKSDYRQVLGFHSLNEFETDFSISVNMNVKEYVNV